MKVIGYGWIKSGETLAKAMERYGVSHTDVKEGQAITKAEKDLLASQREAIKDFKKAVEAKKNRKSAKPRVFRVVIEEAGS